MRGICSGDIAAPPLADLLGVECLSVEPGAVTASLRHRAELQNSDAILHGGATAALIDIAMGAAAHTLESADTQIVTQGMNITFLGPVPGGAMPIRASARVVHRGRNISHVSVDVRDRDDRLVARGSGNFWRRPPDFGNAAT